MCSELLESFVPSGLTPRPLLKEREPVSNNFRICNVIFELYTPLIDTSRPGDTGRSCRERNLAVYEVPASVEN